MESGYSPVHATEVSEKAVQKPKVRKNKFSFKMDKKLIKIFAAVVLVITVAVCTAVMIKKTSVTAQIDESKYQAVFLDNNQVYFGKLHKISGGYFKLTNIFYLQTTSKDDDATESLQDTTSDVANVELIKLGSEVHGPEDKMTISGDQILFFENIESDGKVAASISEYYATNK